MVRTSNERDRPRKPKQSYCAINKEFVKLSDWERQCRRCGRKVKTSGNTTNLKQHFVNHHPKVLEQLLQESQRKDPIIIDDPDDPPPSGSGQDAAGPSTANQNLNTASGSTSNPRASQSETSTMSAPTPAKKARVSQPLLADAFQYKKSYEDGGLRDSVLTNAYLYMVVKDNDPLGKGGKEGFGYFCDKAVPLWKRPGRQKTAKLLDDRYKSIHEDVARAIKNVDGLSLTTDIWSKHRKSFLGVTCHYIEGFDIVNRHLAVKQLDEAHTAENIKNALKDVATEWGITVFQIINIVTDSASNIVRGAKDFASDSKHSKCTAHQINLICDAVMDDVETNEVIDKVSAIVAYANRSIVFADKLRLAQGEKPLVLIQYVSTRWNSKYNMIERFLKLRFILDKLLDEHREGPAMPSREEIIILEEVLKVLMPMEQARRNLSGDSYPTASMVIPMVNCLKADIQQLRLLTNVGIRLKEKLLSEFERANRFGNIEADKNFMIVMVLDPRFKTMHSQKPQLLVAALHRINELLKIELTLQKNQQMTTEAEQPEEKESEGFWKHHDTMLKKYYGPADSSASTSGYHRELKLYLDGNIAERKSNPIKYWYERKSIYPNLAKIAFRYLSIPGTSVPSERLFSTAGDVYSNDRNRLDTERLQKLLMMHSLSRREWEAFVNN